MLGGYYSLKSNLITKKNNDDMYVTEPYSADSL